MDSSEQPEAASPATTATTNTSNTFDVFHWANEIDEIKNNVSVELFLFNKNYTPYRVRYSESLTNSVKALFMQEATGYIIKEADKGLECHEYEKSDGEDKVIYRTNLSNVGRAETLIHLIEHEYRDIDSMSDHLDEFKKSRVSLLASPIPELKVAARHSTSPKASRPVPHSRADHPGNSTAKVLSLSLPKLHSKFLTTIKSPSLKIPSLFSIKPNSKISSSMTTNPKSSPTLRPKNSPTNTNSPLPKV